MEDMFCKFPHIGEGVIAKLSIKTLSKCMKVARTWNRFIVNDKFYKERVKYEKLQMEKDGNGRTPLHRAAENGNFSEFKMIFYHVEDKNPEGYDFTPRFHYVAGGWYSDIPIKFTPLHLAAKNGHFSICQLIVKNIQYEYAGAGRTPLDLAAAHGHFKVFKLLFDNVQDKNGLSKKLLTLAVRLIRTGNL